MGDSAITASGLRRSFGDNEAVAGVELDVAAGEIYGFLGPNGAGKSTVVRMLCTLLAPSGGSATVAGYDVATQAEDIRLRIGVALQDAALDPMQSGTELLRLQGRLYGLSRSDIDRRLAQIGDLVDLGDAIDDRIGTYSGGMKRRLDLAAALVHNPQVLFLDEPTTGLDPVSRARVWDEIRHLNTDIGMTIFLTTQYLEEADVLAGRVGVIDRGTIVAEGSPEELKRRVGSDLIIIRVDGDASQAKALLEGVDTVTSVEVRGEEITVSVPDGAAAVSPVAVALDGSPVEVRELTLRTPTLDDVFLELTGNRIQTDDDPDQEQAS